MSPPEWRAVMCLVMSPWWWAIWLYKKESPFLRIKGFKAGRYYASEALRDPNLQKKAINYTLDKARPVFQKVGSEMLDQISTKVRRNRHHKTDRPDLDGAGVDIHAAIGKLPKPKRGWTLPGHNYTGPYNPLNSRWSTIQKQGRFCKYINNQRTIRSPGSESDDILEALDMAEGVMPKIELILSRLAVLEDKMDGIEKHMRNVDERVSRLYEKVSTLELCLNGHDELVRSVEAKVTSYIADADKMKSDISTLNKNVKSAEEKILNYEADVAKANGEMASLRKQLQ